MVQEMCKEVVIHRTKTARAACSMSMQSDGVVSRCSYCDKRVHLLLWVCGCGTAGNWRGQIETTVTMIEKMGQTVEFMAEKGEGFSGIP